MRRNLKKELIRFNSIYVIFVTQVFIFRPFIAPYLESLGFQGWYISLLFTAFPLAHIIFLPYFASLADKIPRTFMIWAGLLMQALALGLYIIDNSGLIIFAARLLDGLAGAIAGIGILSKLEDLIPSKKRASFTGLSLSLAFLGQFIGPLAGGFIADTFFVQAPFFTSLIILSLLSFLVVENWKSPLFKIKTHTYSPSWKKEIKEFFSNNHLKATGIFGISHHALYPILIVFIPLLVVNKFGLSYFYVGLTTLAYMMPRVFQYYIGKICDSHKASTGIQLGTTITAISILFIPLAPTYILMLCAIFVMGFGESIWNVCANTLISNIGNRSHTQARVHIDYMSIAKIGSLCSFIISGFLARYFSIHSIFIFNSILLFCTLLISIPLYKKEK